MSQSRTSPSAAAERPDVDLVQAAQAGDETAFPALVRRYQNAVGALAFTLTGRFALSEDIAQETFLVTWRRLHEVQPESFRSWLFGVARRTSLRALRDQRSGQGDPALVGVATDLPAPEPSPLERAINQEEEHLIWSTLRNIPETYRLPLVLFYQEQQSMEKVAALLNLSLSNVSVRLTRGRRLLRQHLMETIASALTRSSLDRKFTAAVVAAVLLLGRQPPAASAGTRGRDAVARSTRSVLLTAGAGLAVVALTAVGALELVGAPRAAVVGRTIAAASTGAPPGVSPLRVPPPELAVKARRAAADDAPAPFVFDFDFEDGTLPESFVSGHVVPAAGNPGSLYAAIANITLGNGYRGADTFYDSGKLIELRPKGLHYRETLILSFDLWPQGGFSYSVEVYNADRQSNFNRQVEAPAGRWTRLTVPLSSLVAAKEGRAMELGDRLTAVKIAGGHMVGPPFMIDNLRIADAPPPAN